MTVIINRKYLHVLALSVIDFSDESKCMLQYSSKNNIYKNIGV